MLLIPKFQSNGELILDAFSYNLSEIKAVETVLTNANVQAKYSIISNDLKDRYGRRFEIISEQINSLENYLNIKFERSESTVKVRLVIRYSNYTGNAGNSFKCTRIDPPNECETIYANDEDEAIVKCALIANNKNWLGGVPFPGAC